MKVIHRHAMGDIAVEAIANETTALRHLSHPNIVKLYDIFDDRSNIYLVLEYVRGGELFARLSKKTIYTEKEARDICRIILSAIQHCHSNDIVHRDLKCENLLMLSDDSDSDVKLVDFGFAKKAATSTLDGRMGTPIYMAPEIWKNELYGKPVDMWAFGVITYILLGGYPPFSDNDRLKLERRIKKANYLFHDQYWGNVTDEGDQIHSPLL